MSPGHPVALEVVLKLSGLTHTSVSEQHQAGHAVAVRKPDRLITEETPERTVRIVKKSGGERRLSPAGSHQRRHGYLGPAATRHTLPSSYA